MNRTFLSSPIGEICIEADDEAITALYLVDYHQTDETKCELLIEAKKQLREYFNGNRQQFNLPVHIEGTEFQLKVWNVLSDIPYGTTCSYGDIAEKIGNVKASRAVGGAVHKNPVMIILPCHRVIGSNGSLVGFGAGLDVKVKLLNIEK